MTKKSFIIILISSVVVTYGVAIVQFAIGKMGNGAGLPFGFSYFNFLGSETNQTMLFLDIAFWFIILLIGWKIILKIIKR